MEERNDILHHSEEVHDIIGQSPPSILYGANILIGLIVFGILTGASFIKYPDIVSGTVTITTLEPPVKLVARSAGKITDLYVKDGEPVSKEQIIAVIDNPAKTSDVLLLKAVVNALSGSVDLKKTTRSLYLPENLIVGDIQPNYAYLSESLANYKFFVANNYFAHKLENLRAQKDKFSKITNNIQVKEKYLADQQKLEAWRDSVNYVLLKTKVISLSEYNTIKKTFLNQSISKTDNTSSLLQNQEQQVAVESNASDLRQQYNTGNKEVIINLKDAISRVRGQIAAWQRQYVLESSERGTLTYFWIRNTGQTVNAGDPVFMIVPERAQYQAIVKLPLFKAGKIRPGQEVLLKLQEYPFEEFGALKATVKKISNVTMDNFYAVELELKDGFVTTRRKKIDPRTLSSGVAEFKTSDQSVLQRIFNVLYGKVGSK
ncbi:HlyD family efflux transporter periplasmic adaptor subunit [Mucilaginibacter terrenus]|uniref:HlyD family efflux transporter periplasmic adaptor subunit n=1 Tax=Mucilaginibacter terrenus TaxID=2482727 RepID=A0A3E2NWC7_9SPHI|nr:HlyD family efflux transporter periplasmic adaptor subunit [Mucilaginibacter terrenus]RFZ85160.1 HlyD family efflux transporter periplasmic adaptor subunit [Mucilaginibacter terrenus]